MHPQDGATENVEYEKGFTLLYESGHPQYSAYPINGVRNLGQDI
jgi:hypothetical protein